MCSFVFVCFPLSFFFFFFNDTATTEIYTLSLHDALPIYGGHLRAHQERAPRRRVGNGLRMTLMLGRLPPVVALAAACASGGASGGTTPTPYTPSSAQVGDRPAQPQIGRAHV